ncbi:MurR/RpiR family transcriptional regulator [Caproiciproducens sp. LBM24188]|nr:MurR/RpiR family transcriptional regulator [Oscillospiraceae bacterium]HHV30784.1 MurR/RpiR family transcriptional regulator [Clostridiales bacterium]
MAQDIFSKIQASEKIFTKAERKVADYIIDSPKEALYMSITDLAQHCGVGDTTVFRFCRTLKLDGYQDFKMMLAQSLSTQDDSSSVALSEEIKRNDSLDEVCRKLLATDIAALNQTFSMINEEDIHRAVEMIEKARVIHFFGVGSSGIMAQEAKNKFSRVLPNVVFTMDSHMQAMESALLDERDLAIAFSYSGSTKDTIDILKRAKANKTNTICITRYAESPLTIYADITLLCGANEGPFQGGSLSVRVAQLYLLDVLYTEYFKRNYGTCDHNIKSTTQAIAGKLL